MVDDMLDNIGSEDNIEPWLRQQLEAGNRLMGFGHRVYKNFDPRATILKRSADDVLEALNIDDPLLDIAKGLEEIALKDKYFIERAILDSRKLIVPPCA